MKKGEVWYVKINNNAILSKFKISDLTEHTVELETEDYFPRYYRYERKSISFIEKIK